MTDAKRDMYTCYYCQLHHPLVEAGGMWHCPNPLCTGPGAQMWRLKCKSYQERGDVHTVDADEMILVAMEILAKSTDKALVEHAMACIPKWREEKPRHREVEVVRSATGVDLLVEQEGD